MRALLVTNLFRPVTLGGYERGCAEFADHFTGLGHEVRVLTTDLTDAPPGAVDPGGLAVDRVLRSYRRLDGSYAEGSVRWRMATERWNLAALRNLVRRWRPDVLMWWNLGGLNASLLEAGRRLGTPACAVVNDYWVHWAPYVDPWVRLKWKVPGLGTLADRTLGFPDGTDHANAAHWIFVSDYVRREIESKLGPLPRTSIVHSGIDTAVFRPRPEDPPWRGRLLFVGRVTRNKGIDLAVEALAATDDATLTICGPRDASSGPELEAQIRDLGVEHRVRFTHAATPADVAAEYAAHDAVVFPGRWAEPWGKVPLEAMACGVPVITSATGGSAEYSRDGDTCLVARSSDEITAAIRRLAGDAELRRSLAQRGAGEARRYDLAQANRGRAEILLRVPGEASAHRADRKSGVT